MEGRIHSTESFGTVDGPGIRFVVFMQGCPLRCKYCHNRDTWDVGGGTPLSCRELIKKILRDKPYFSSSGGGVTVSGGEPLLQAEFVTELFKELKTIGIHTCLDTSGNLPITSQIKELLQYTDLVLLDIKHINSEKCKELTGLSNDNELAFAKYLSNHQIPVWIRQVLVPGYTNDKFDLKNLKVFIDTLSNVENVEILPYHDLGKYKWKEMGLEYPFENIQAPSDKEIQEAKNILGI
ncbi:MAG: pyruvate formate lyase-activating protein [Clostridia bacterium]|nr:pyruvate formate lyase-activating protein [Clostridia bacterium]